MLVYIAAPYSKVLDKEKLMRDIARFCGDYMLKNKGQYAVTGLVHHYASVECPSLGTNYAFWVDFCELFIKQCGKLVVVKFEGWDTSTGVAAELELAKTLMIPIEFHDPV